MTQMRHFVTIGVVAAGLALTAGAAKAQTVIGGVSEPGVEVNLDVLDSLGPDTGGAGNLYGTTNQAPAGSGSVLLLEPPAGSGTTLTQPTSNGASVLLLDQPVTTPSVSTNAFVFPEVPQSKPAVPESAIVTSVSQTESTAETTTTTTTTTIVTQPAPEPEPAAAPAMPEPEAEVLVAATGTADSAGNDPFAQIEDMLDEPIAPEAIVVPEPAMEMETTEVVSLPSSQAVTGGSRDLQLLFEPGVDSIATGDRAVLDQLAERLSGSPDQRIQLRAYASSDDGTASAARRLALARALQVRAYLIENGVRSTRIDVRALGDKVEDTGPLDRIDIVLVES